LGLTLFFIFCLGAFSLFIYAFYQIDFKHLLKRTPMNKTFLETFLFIWFNGLLKNIKKKYFFLINVYIFKPYLIADSDL